jgi:hypothetical protein
VCVCVGCERDSLASRAETLATREGGNDA